MTTTGVQEAACAHGARPCGGRAQRVRAGFLPIPRTGATSRSFGAQVPVRALRHRRRRPTHNTLSGNTRGRRGSTPNPTFGRLRRREYDKAQKLLVVSQQLTETRAALSVALCIEVARISASPEYESRRSSSRRSPSPGIVRPRRRERCRDVLSQPWPLPSSSLPLRSPPLRSTRPRSLCGREARCEPYKSHW